MYLLVIAWAYVVLMMCLAEATSPQGTLLGAFFTLLLYGVLPISIVLYLMATPLRRKALREALKSAQAADNSNQQSPSALNPDTSSHAAGDAVAPEGEESRRG
jgi:hypothetical protein